MITHPSPRTSKNPRPINKKKSTPPLKNSEKHSSIHPASVFPSSYAVAAAVVRRDVNVAESPGAEVPPLRPGAVVAVKAPPARKASAWRPEGNLQHQKNKSCPKFLERKLVEGRI